MGSKLLESNIKCITFRVCLKRCGKVIEKCIFLYLKTWCLDISVKLYGMYIEENLKDKQEINT